MATFLQMQTTLSHLLGESGVGDSYWTQAEKQRLLNEGLLDVVIRTRQLETTATFTTQDGVGRLTPPSDMLLPRKLFIDGKTYRRISLEQYVELLNGDIDDTQKYVTTDNGTRGRFYVWHRDTSLVDLLPLPKGALAGLWHYMKKPATLSADVDVPATHESTHHLPPLYAAWKLSYRDREHAEKGQLLRNEYFEALNNVTAFFNASIDDNLDTNWGLDPEYYSRTGFETFQEFERA